MEFKEYSAKSVEEAITEATIDLGTTSDNIEYEVITEGSTGILSMFSRKEAVIRARIKPAPKNEVEEFMCNVIEKMGVSGTVTVETDEEEKVINITVDGENCNDLIGKKGVTLDALQYLASIVANKEKEGYYRVKLDTMNYRERRQKTLENLAKNMASKVKKTRRKVVLEPMNPYERRIIHSYLQGDESVTTKSEGEEPNRRIVIYYKK